MPPVHLADNNPTSNAESWYHLELSKKQRIRFVLDASDLGLKSQNKALQLLHSLCDQLPRFSQHSITFLGSKTVYDAGLLETNGADWFSNNKLRLSSIAPVYELAENDIRFVVIAASPLFDLMDWKDSPELNRTVFFNLGQESVTGGLANELPPDSHRAAEIMQSPLKSVVIQADHAFPIYWDNRSYSLDEGFGLQSQKAETFSVTFALTGSAAHVRALCTHENGKRDLLEVSQIEPRSLVESWAPLAIKAEAEIAHACITKGEFTCPHCRKVHQRNQLACVLQGQFLPTSVFSSISRNPECVFALLRADDRDTVSFSSIYNPALALDGTDVAIFHQGHPKLVEYDSLKNQWCLSERPFKQFSFLERWGAYAICLR